MAKSNKGKLPVTPVLTGKTLPKTSIEQDPDVKFSFKYLDFENKKFSLIDCEKDFLVKTFERFKEVSSYKYKEFRHNYTKSLRNHKIIWDKTSELAGFSHFNSEFLEQVVEGNEFQFQLSQGMGRYHGFWIDETFYLVWFDSNHLLYNGKH